MLPRRFIGTYLLISCVLGMLYSIHKRYSSNSGVSDQALYTDRDIVDSLDRIDTIDFHQELEVNGIKFSAYHAGHVLGAAMFNIEIAGVKVSSFYVV